jgi:AAA family ATP:ADP antiporter
VNWRRNVHAGEGLTLLLAAAAFFCILTSYYIIRPVRDALIGASGSRSLPLTYSITFLVMLLATPLFGALVRRYPRRRLIIWSFGFFIATLVGFAPVFSYQALIGVRMLATVFFVWASVFPLFVVSLFWSFMADIWDSTQARRLFAYVAFGGALGTLVGPQLTTRLVEWIGVSPLLLVSAVLLALSLGAMLLIDAPGGEQAASDDAAIGGTLWAGLRQVFTQPFVRSMAVLMLLGDGIGTLAYALMADYTKTHFVHAAARTAFYGNLDFSANLICAVTQLLFTRWVLVRKGPTWGLVIPSLISVVLLLAVFAFGSDAVVWPFSAVPLLAVMLVVHRGLAYGMYKPASDALYTRAAREARYKGKNFVETAVWRFGDVVITSALDLLRALQVGIGTIALAATSLAGLAAWIGSRVGRSPDLAAEDDQPPVATAPSRGG